MQVCIRKLNKIILTFLIFLFYLFIKKIFFKAIIFLHILKETFIYLFMAVLGLRCCTRAFSSCSERGLLFVVVRRLLIEVASLVWSTGSRFAGSVVVACGL